MRLCCSPSPKPFLADWLLLGLVILVMVYVCPIQLVAAVGGEGSVDAGKYGGVGYVGLIRELGKRSDHLVARRQRIR